MSEMAITRASRNVWYTWSTACDPQSKYSTPPYSLSSLTHFQSNTWQTWFYPHKQLTCLVSHTHYRNSFSTLTNQLHACVRYHFLPLLHNISSQECDEKKHTYSVSGLVIAVSLPHIRSHLCHPSILFSLF